MPTYDYLCDACGHEIEIFHSIKDEAHRKCPKCKRLKLRRLIGPGAGIVFKGSGFYQTDYRSESYKQSAAAEKTRATASTSSAKSDAKSKDKKDTKATTGA